MKTPARRYPVRRYVEDLLRQRRPRRFRATEQDAADLRAAIALRAGRAQDGEPSETFVAELRDRLAAELGEETAPPPSGETRRRFVKITTAAAAAAAAGAAVDHVVTQAGAAAAPPEQTLVPDNGEWRAVVTSADLPDGSVRPFDLGAVAGFLQRSGDQVRAVSATCTHLGCRLNLDAPARQLNCPCHRTSFSVDGALLFHELPVAPPPLPHLLVRESAGKIEVFVPPPA